MLLHVTWLLPVFWCYKAASLYSVSNLFLLVKFCIHSVNWSVVCQLVTIVNSGKMADSIEMSFWAVGQVRPVDGVLDGDPDPPWEGANFGAMHCKVSGENVTLIGCTKTDDQLSCHLG